ncbi:transcriptional regulator [Streptomyces sp. NPDC047042]|uniref:transcriptional regulator n=1 Tax=Streptomyces sp. NPDC047042 TaxID=3154807 RepID=UPI0033D0FA32
MRRRDVLALLAVTGAQIALPGADLSPLGCTAAVAAESGGELHRSLWQVYALSDSKRAVFPAVRHQLDVLVRSLDEVRSPTERQQICTLIADIYQLAGEVLFDAHEYTDAAHCYALAANAAQGAGNYDLWACAMTRHAYVELYTQRAFSAEPLLDAAFKVAQRGDSTLSTRYWVAAVQAEAYAYLGDSDSCMRALDEAERVQTLSGQIHNGGWLRFDGSRLAEERGACYLQLGRPDLAEEALTTALAQDLSLRRRGAVLVDLAALGIQQGDVDQALHYADAALTLADQTHSGYIGAKLSGLRPRLATLASNDRTSDLEHRIAALAGAA